MRIAVIPARGGSKRIPGKNIKNFCGKPIIAWSIEAALKSGCFDKVIVSTDDAEIADISRKFGAEVPFIRPARLADDFTNTNPVVLHAIEYFESLGCHIDVVACIYATAPFLAVEDIIEAVEVIRLTPLVDFVVTVTHYAFPIQRAMSLSDDNLLVFNSPKYALSRSQDLTTNYHDAGQLYCGRPASFKRFPILFEGNVAPIFLHPRNVQDIDTIEDFERAEDLYKVLHKDNLGGEAGGAILDLHASQCIRKDPVSKLVLGTAQLGLHYGVANSYGKMSQAECSALLTKARHAGISMLDTAIEYGDSELILGGINAGEDWRIITKLPSLPKGLDTVADWVDEQLTISLSKLQVCNVHGLLLHKPEQLLGADGLALYGALLDQRERGRVTKIGVSIYAPEELDKFPAGMKFDIVQAPLNVLDRRMLHSGWARRLQDSGCEFHARSVFLQGLLLMPPAARPHKFNQWSAMWHVWDAWLKVNNVTALQACLGFVLCLDCVDKLVIGVDNEKHLMEMLSAIKGGALPEPPRELSMDDPLLLNPALWRKI